MNSTYARISYQVNVDGFVIEVFDAISVTKHGPYDDFSTAEMVYHHVYPNGYIIPDWLGW